MTEAHYINTPIKRAPFQPVPLKDVTLVLLEKLKSLLITYLLSFFIHSMFLPY